MTVDVEGDSATIRICRIDTLFSLNEKTKLRKYKGYLFINSFRLDYSWRVKILKLQNNQLEFEDLVSQYEIDTLKEITSIVTEFDTITN